MFSGAKGRLRSFRCFPGFERLLDFLYPESCLACAQLLRLKKLRPPEDSPFCNDCLGKIHRLTGPSCLICARPASEENQGQESLCGDCREDPPFFKKAITPYFYEHPLSAAIQALKYRKQTRLAPFLARLLAAEIGDLEIDCVMAIPLHPERLRMREFNQSLLLAKTLSKYRKWPLDIDSLQRIRSTESQVGLSKQARKKNIKGAFSVRHAKAIRGSRIILIDDVYTTGATLKEAASALVLSGAKSVIVAAPTRMLLRRSPVRNKDTMPRQIDSAS